MKTITLDGQNITPSKIICIGRNYVEHIAELDNEIPDDMVIFSKPNSAISSTLCAYNQEQLHYEGELCFVFQQGIFSAVGFGLDLTKRSLQSTLKNKGLPWERAKAFDGAAVFSDFVSIKKVNLSLQLELSINQQLVQKGGVELMMYSPDEILHQVQQIFTLEEGDIVMTGTPKGVGTINKGDNFEAKVLLNNSLLVSAQWLAE